MDILCALHKRDKNMPREKAYFLKKECGRGSPYNEVLF
jgi:hypothetical protein